MAAEYCTVVCTHCHSEFSYTRVKRPRTFCSAECRRASKLEHDPRGHKCEWCSKRFTGRKNKYCSDECAAASHYNSTMICRYIKHNHGAVSESERQRLIEEFVSKHGCWWGYLAGINDSNYYRSPEYKRIQRVRAGMREGRTLQYRPLPEHRSIHCAHCSRVEAWKKYLKACRRLDEPREPSPAEIMTEEQRKQSEARRWRWRYRNDPEFRFKQKERLLAKKQRRRHDRRLRSDGTVTASVIGNATSCLYCGARLTEKNRTIDHMTPLNRGGWHSASNVVECCRSCNSSKSDKPFLDWVETLAESHRLRALEEFERLRHAHSNTVGASGPYRQGTSCG